MCYILKSTFLMLSGISVDSGDAHISILSGILGSDGFWRRTHFYLIGYFEFRWILGTHTFLSYRVFWDPVDSGDAHISILSGILGSGGFWRRTHFYLIGYFGIRWVLETHTFLSYRVFWDPVDSGDAHISILSGILGSGGFWRRTHFYLIGYFGIR